MDLELKVRLTYERRGSADDVGVHLDRQSSWSV